MRRAARLVALGLVLAGACRSAPPQDAALRWLETDCAWSRSDSIEALRGAAGRVEPALLAHLRAGPPPSVTARAREAYAFEYGVADRLARGRPLPFPVGFRAGEEDPSFESLRIGLDAWVARRLDALASAWRGRAVLGLELLATPQAADALGRAAADTGAPWSADAAAALQRVRAGLPPP